jgi:FdhD protein
MYGCASTLRHPRVVECCEGMSEALLSSITRVPILKVDRGACTRAIDALAIEEPLELRLRWGAATGRREQALSITMRTPGSDLELAVGFLVGEGIARGRQAVVAVRHEGRAVRPDGTSNVVKVVLAEDVRVDVTRLERHFYTTSSCGVCGKTSIEALRTTSHPALPEGSPVISGEVLHALPHILRASQATFDETGGLHAAAVFDSTGHLLLLREDVGRHNAVDKVIGALALTDALPASAAVLLVSGRASFELVQKARMAGVPVLAAVGAPSSLAVDLARAGGMTLVGFLRNDRFNVYAGQDRIVSAGLPRMP